MVRQHTSISTEVSSHLNTSAPVGLPTSTMVLAEPTPKIIYHCVERPEKNAWTELLLGSEKSFCVGIAVVISGSAVVPFSANLFRSSTAGRPVRVSSNMSMCRANTRCRVVPMLCLQKGGPRAAHIIVAQMAVGQEGGLSLQPATVEKRTLKLGYHTKKSAIAS